jgi:hypothetical protein
MDHGESRSQSWDALDSPVSAFLSYLVLLGGLITIGLAAYMVLISYSSLPYSDGWTQIFVVARGENPLSASWLWHQHNEHRLVLPKLLLVADLRLFQARQIFLLGSIFTIQLLHWLLLGWSMSRLGGWRGSRWRSGAGLAAFCLFCPSQWENLVWGFQTCFVLPGLFATLSFVGLLLCWRASQNRDRGGGWKFLALSMVAALGATYSLASGNLLWPILVVAAVLLRLRLAAVLSYCVTGAVSTALYFHGYIRPLQNSDPAASIRSPLKLIEYLTAYFGSSWVRQNVGLAVCLGAAGVVLAFVFCSRWRRCVADAEVFSVQLILILLYCTGTGFLTALGRMSSGDMQAFSSRYQTVALMFWCGLGLLLLSVPAVKAMRVSIVVVQLLLLVVMARGAVLARFPLRHAREHAFQLDAASAALILQVNDRRQLEHAFPLADYVSAAAPFMREKRLSIFAGGVGPTLGERLDSAFRLASSDDCVGAVQSAERIGDDAAQDLRITGWAWDRKRQRPPRQIVAAADGVVVGLGAMGDWRPTVRAVHPYLKTSFIGFTGYVKGMKPSAPVTVYAVLDRNQPQVCPIANLGPGVP